GNVNDRVEEWQLHALNRVTPDALVQGPANCVQKGAVEATGTFTYAPTSRSAPRGGRGVRPYTLPFFAKNRSMIPVSNFPARKSGSARIFRCSGIVVYTPSTINISSARAMREHASSRSFARTISLAISES